MSLFLSAMMRYFRAMVGNVLLCINFVCLEGNSATLHVCVFEISLQPGLNT